MPKPEADSPGPEHRAIADIESEPTEGHPSAAKHRMKPKLMPKRARRRSRKPTREPDPDTISLMTELSQININLGQLLDQQQRREDDQAQKLRDAWTHIPCAPVTSMELFSGSCFLHNEWYAGFEVRISRDLKTYFLAIAGAEWHNVISPNISRNFFNFRGACIQVDDRLELISIGRGPSRDGHLSIHSLGAWDQRALSASESITHFTEGDSSRTSWKVRRDLAELRESVDAHWPWMKVGSGGIIFRLRLWDLSSNGYKFDPLVFIEEGTAFPELRRLGVCRDAVHSEGNIRFFYQWPQPDEDPRPVIGHIW